MENQEKAQKTELEVFAENANKRKLETAIRNEPGRDLSGKLFKVAKFKATYNKDKEFEKDQNGIIKNNKFEAVFILNSNSEKMQQIAYMPLAKILAYNNKATLGKGNVFNPAFVYCVVK